MKKFYYKKLSHVFVLIILLVFGFSSCKILNPTQMLRTPKNFDYAKFSDTLLTSEYIISPRDEIDMRIYTLDGEKLIEITSSSNMQMQSRGIIYKVETDGSVKLPLIRNAILAGMTEKEAELHLEEVYSKYLNDPFVQLNVVNKKVVVFPGNEGGNAKVLTLKNPQTTLFDALAEVGGIADGRSDRIKLIRGDLKNPDIFLIDLSTIRGMTEANLTLQANDIIIVQPRAKVAQKILREITPYLSLITTVLVVYGLFR
ncbi:MAG: polysaccharide biosynthesis/export family protein [Bacteroidales bacterium]|jgi:polysaccharide export outer membrane protein